MSTTILIPDLLLHLYLNAFKNEKSTFARERGGKLVGLKEGWGWIDIQRLSVDGVDALASLEYIQPDDHNSDDQTVARVSLKSPLLPDQTVTVELDFEAQLPRVFVRTGYRKDYYFVAQWFPKLGVWEPIGRRGRTEAGWTPLCEAVFNRKTAMVAFLAAKGAKVNVRTWDGATPLEIATTFKDNEIIRILREHGAF